MKKILFFVVSILLLASCDWFVFDNYEQPKATVVGKFLDVKTGELVAQECRYGNMFGGMYNGAPYDGYISAIQKGWDYESPLYWHIKYDGSYSNTRVYQGDYRLEAKNNNFVPIEQDVKIVNGNNTIDWTVTPYCRILGATFNKEGDYIVAKFKVEAGNPAANVITEARLCAYTDTFVGYYLNNCDSDPEAVIKNVVADGTTEYTLKINTKLVENTTQFEYTDRTHYLRLAVCCTGTGVNTAGKYNYTQTTTLKF